MGVCGLHRIFLHREAMLGVWLEYGSFRRAEA